MVDACAATTLPAYWATCLARTEAIAVHYRAGDMAKAQAALERALAGFLALDRKDAKPSMQPDILETRAHLGRVLDNQASALLKSDPEAAKTLRARARAEYEAAQAAYDEATRSDDSTLRMRQQHAHLELNRALHDEASGRPSEALNRLEYAASAASARLYVEGEVQCLYTAGRMCNILKNYDRAIAFFEQALAKATDRLGAGICHQNMGVAYAALGDHARAEAAYRKALGTDGFDADVHPKFHAFTTKLLAELPKAEPYSFRDD